MFYLGNKYKYIKQCKEFVTKNTLEYDMLKPDIKNIRGDKNGQKN